MKCLECNGSLKVVNVAKSSDNINYRYLRCKDCGHKYYTEERISETPERVRFKISTKMAEKYGG